MVGHPKADGAFLAGAGSLCVCFPRSVISCPTKAPTFPTSARIKRQPPVAHTLPTATASISSCAGGLTVRNWVATAMRPS